MILLLNKTGIKLLIFSFLLSSLFINGQNSQQVDNSTGKKNIDHIKDDTVTNFLNLVASKDEKVLNNALLAIDKNWKESHEIMLFEAFYFSQRKEFSRKLLNLLQRKTQKQFGYDFDKWLQWFWNKDVTYKDDYFEFKAKLHQRIDQRFYTYFFGRAKQSTIRLDEVRWGGVIQDGIPPLRNPKMISVKKATYLNESDVVFGIEVNGDARAYPKRILAWHEMFVDSVGGVPVAGVYCTLCGTVILYKTEFEGKNYDLGTSGFLYRSNKLMYDKATQSLWSTLEGSPVIGPLVGKGIELDFLSVVTTTWGEWKERHPETTVLSLDTGYGRDYGEGVAYKNYFATDELMFTIPEIDKSLKNKDEILAIRMPKVTNENLAISDKFLRKNPIYQNEIADISFVVFTDKSGAHRVYKSEDKQFSDYDGSNTAIDQNGVSWTLSEENLTSEAGAHLSRIPTHNAFWFGYKAAFPDVELIR